MPYCTQAELVDRYGEPFLVQLTDRAETATGTIDADVVTRAISEADDLIDGYVKGRYTLPFDTTPDLVSTISARLAIYNLHVYEPSEKILREYKDAITTLEKIAKGIIQLDAAGETPATTGQGDVRVTERDRPFTGPKMTGFI